MAETKQGDIVILNTIQAAAADIVFGPGSAFILNDGTNDLMKEIKLFGSKTFTATSFVAGTAAVTDIDTIIGVPIIDKRVWVVEVTKLTTPNAFVQEETNSSESRTRRYAVTLADSSTDAQLRQAFIDRINADPDAFVVASSNSNDLRLTTNDATANIRVTNSFGLVVTETTPHVAPAGTEAIVNGFVTGGAASGGEYTTYEIIQLLHKSGNSLNPGEIGEKQIIRIFADEGATNFAAFDTELLAVMAGTHTPATDYDGV